MTLSLAVRHLESGPLVLPLEALLYLRKQSWKSIPAERGGKFHTTREQAAELIERTANVVKAVRKRVSVLFDGAYANRSLLRRLLEQGVTLFSRWQKNSHPRSLLPPVSKDEARRGCPRKYGPAHIDLAEHAAQRGAVGGRFDVRCRTKT